MSITDLVADALTIIRNATKVGKDEVLIPYSKILTGIIKILKEEGYIDNFKEIELGTIKKIKIYLKYEKGKSSIRQIRKISSPGRRIYVKNTKIPSVLSGYGTAIISTSKGVISDIEAKELGLGGEVICYVW
ncbi:MAG: 30S ribosomal protein S8 [Candidatus Omnitrophota bacterium]